ncbi:MAG: IS21 family transposase [Candidatus Dormibacteria bacterium]
MRKIREVLRLVLGEGLSRHRAATATGVPYTSVAECLSRAAKAGLQWPLPGELDDRELEARLYRRAAVAPSRQRPQPDWAEVHRELGRKGVTLQLLWMEFKQRCPEGHQYTQFVRYYRRWAGQLDVVLRQDHRAGEKLFLDFAGQTVPITDPGTGVVTQSQLFVGVLGASSYTYAEALPSQELVHWIAAHVRLFEYLGGAPEILVPDNLRAGVTRSHRYEPELNPSYLEMASHYGCAVIPARPYKPRDKAKVEAGVLLAERWILASLRHHTFFSLAEANLAIRERLDRLNDRPFQKLEGSRRSLFLQLDRPSLRLLPERPYEFATWKVVTVNIDYHVELDRHYYSVPYQLARQRCEVRLTATTVEVLCRGRRVASHRRSLVRGGHTTLPEHMPESHRRHLEWTPSRIVRWAENTGPQTASLVDGILRSRPHPEQGFRSCLGILRLGQRYGGDRLEAACTRAVTFQAFSYRSVESILRRGLDRQPLPLPAPPTVTPRHHEYVRGAAYYQ